MHARWVCKLDQVRRIGHLHHFLDLFANKSCTSYVLEDLMGIEILRVEIVITGRLLQELISALVGEKFKVTLSDLLVDTIEGAEHNKCTLRSFFALGFRVGQLAYEFTDFQFFDLDHSVSFPDSLHQFLGKRVWWHNKSCKVWEGTGKHRSLWCLFCSWSRISSSNSDSF